MKTNYHLKSRDKRGSGQKIFVAIIFFAILFSVRFVFGFKLESLFGFISKPIETERMNFASSRFYFLNYFRSKDFLTKEILNLKNEISQLKTENIEYIALKSEYNNLLNFSDETLDLATSSKISPDGIVSKVVSKPPFSPYDSLKIDGGLNDGISVGDDVFAQNSIYIGFVNSTLDNFSNVTLFSSGDFVTEGFLERNNLPLQIKGVGGGNFHTTIPKDFDIKEGDFVVSGKSGGYIIAKVNNINKTSQGSFKEIYLNIPISIFELSFVKIVGI